MKNKNNNNNQQTNNKVPQNKKATVEDYKAKIQVLAHRYKRRDAKLGAVCGKYNCDPIDATIRGLRNMETTNAEVNDISRLTAKALNNLMYTVGEVMQEHKELKFKDVRDWYYPLLGEQ
ncbi:hypothetical protein PPL_05172 [Heterostelium album PN500]|uniref:Uncharacterized protein n=1 Tax=Heterostelium pallidum (strain ATCC 26659 / Pp 5 / PN500) TaxID=670386 RepID=D3B9M7_HETP5|nr:hypothetical protein PPL_05172 [Heterostelium album PN500]EFA81939.1 hypothetical protein PPL_05172 [Heterostelium album PN500]|eukprot:XP_020434056.1 hypothetical protein PPL_05172 [Heterostelium album PN500]